MSAHPRIFSMAEFNGLLADGMREAGIEESAIPSLIKHPRALTGMTALAVCERRGLRLTAVDLADCLRETYPDGMYEDGTPLDPMTYLFGPHGITHLIDWALKEQRGEFSMTAQVVARIRARQALGALERIGQEPTLEETLAALKSRHQAVRTRARQWITGNVTRGLEETEPDPARRRMVLRGLADELAAAEAGDHEAADRIASRLRVSMQPGETLAAPTEAQVWSDLESNDRQTRADAGDVLRKTLLKGMRLTESFEDLEHLEPRLHRTIALAVDGTEDERALAREELKRETTTEHPGRYKPVREPEAADFPPREFA